MQVLKLERFFCHCIGEWKSAAILELAFSLSNLTRFWCYCTLIYDGSATANSIYLQNTANRWCSIHKSLKVFVWTGSEFLKNVWKRSNYGFWRKMSSISNSSESFTVPRIIDQFGRKRCQKKRKDLKRFFLKNILFCMSKIMSLHTYVILRTVYFGWICKSVES